MEKKVLVTGCAGFIGYHLSEALCQRNEKVFGIDNLNDYYDPSLKIARLNELKKHSDFTFEKLDIADRDAMSDLFLKHRFTHVVHLAAQAGVRYSMTNPYAYIDSNLVGFGNILENCRQHEIKNFVFASSSSVYGANKTAPFQEKHPVDHPIALYGATKKANEVMAHSYAHLYQLPSTGLRFFTVYGPWGRPDMAPIKFTEKIIKGEPIDIYNYGKMQRDFTYIDDIIEGMMRVIDKPACGDENWDATGPNLGRSDAPFKIYNIGYGKPIQLMDFVTLLEDALGIKAKKQLLPMQPGDVIKTFADTSDLEKAFGFKPQIAIEKGVKRFVDWYKTYYNI